MRIVFGTIAGFLIAVLLFYFSSGVIEIGVPFYTGFILAIVIVLAVSLMVYGVFFKPRAVEDSQAGQYMSLARMFLPKASEEQIILVKDLFNRGLRIRLIITNIQIIISLFLVIGGILGSAILLKQNEIIGGQSKLLKGQNDLMAEQNTYFERQNNLVQSQSDLFRNQNELLENQNSLTADQSDLLTTQNFLYVQEIDQAKRSLRLFEVQNSLLSKQDSLLSKQIALSRNLGNSGADDRGSGSRIDFKLNAELDKILNWLENWSRVEDNGQKTLNSLYYQVIADFTRKARPSFLYNSPISDYSRYVSLEKSRLLRFLLKQNYQPKVYDELFRMSDFSHCLFLNENLSGSYLRGADLGGSCFERCDLSKSDLSSANLSYCDLTGAFLNDVLMY